MSRRPLHDPDHHREGGGDLGPLFELRPSVMEPTMIVDRMDSLARGTYTPTPEMQELCDAFSQVRGAEERSLFNGFFTAAGRAADGEGRPPISGSSPFYCPKRLAFKMVGAEEEKPAPRVLMAWYMGRCIESMVTRLMILTNPSLSWPRLIDGKLVEKEVTFLHGTHGAIHGHVDGVVVYEGKEVPVEIKSHADFGFRKVKKSNEVPNLFGHRSQLNFYCAAMGADRGFYVAVNKSTGHRCEIEHRFDRGLFESDMASVAEADGVVGMGMMPERPSWALTRQTLVERPDTYKETLAAIVCQYCPFTTSCWPSFARFTNDKGKPEWRKVSA